MDCGVRCLSVKRELVYQDDVDYESFICVLSPQFLHNLEVFTDMIASGLFTFPTINHSLKLYARGKKMSAVKKIIQK